MDVILNSLDLLRATRKYPFDMGEISENQWLAFGEEFIYMKESHRTQEDLMFIFDNAQMKVKFSESNDVSIKSMIANVKIEYLHRSGKLSSLKYQFCSYGQVNNPTSEASECWQKVMLNANETKVDI